MVSLLALAAATCHGGAAQRGSCCTALSFSRSFSVQLRRIQMLCLAAICVTIEIISGAVLTKMILAQQTPSLDK